MHPGREANAPATHALVKCASGSRVLYGSVERAAGHNNSKMVDMVSHAHISFQEDVVGLFKGKEKILFRRGEKAVVWAGREGKTWTQFKKMILKTRGKRCEECDGDGELHIHHIVPVSKNPALLYDKRNCVILCVSCHKKRHSNY